jgi:hypothetical protein
MHINLKMVILAGIGLLVLDRVIRVLDITYADKSFWFVMVPLAFVLGLLLRHIAGGDGK